MKTERYPMYMTFKLTENGRSIAGNYKQSKGNGEEGSQSEYACTITHMVLTQIDIVGSHIHDCT